MRRGRKPKPTALKKLARNPGKRELNEDEPEPTKNPINSPRWLDAIAMEEWARIEPYLRTNGILTDGDRAALEAYCMVYARWRQAEGLLNLCPSMIIKTKTGYTAPVPWVTISQRYMQLMLAYLAEFGLTPAARVRVYAGKSAGGEKGKEDEDFFGDKKEGRPAQFLH